MAIFIPGARAVLARSARSGPPMPPDPVGGLGKASLRLLGTASPGAFSPHLERGAEQPRGKEMPARVTKPYFERRGQHCTALEPGLGARYGNASVEQGVLPGGANRSGDGARVPADGGLGSPS